MKKNVTVKFQQAIVKYVTGTHQTLLQFYKKEGEQRRRTWRMWVKGEASGDIFHKEDLPVIAHYFWEVWDAPIPEGTAIKDITPTVLDLVKREIVELLVRMHMIPADRLDCMMVRRSRRHVLVRNVERAEDIVPDKWTCKQKSLTS